MRQVMAVTFGPHERLHYLDPDGVEYRCGDALRVPTDSGPEVARCVVPPWSAEWAGPDLPQALGPATADDLDRDAHHRAKREAIRVVANELIAEHGLAMTVVGVDFIDPDPDAGRVAVVYFRAPRRVDFRVLVKDLARRLRARVELRQLGGRDVCALVGGAGVCGRELCCRSGCPVSAPVSTRVSAAQEAANAALQLAGVCGRAKCCLAFEARDYADFAARAPAVGSVVGTPDGGGVVSGHAMPADAVWVQGPDGTRAVAVADTSQVGCPDDVQRAGSVSR